VGSRADADSQPKLFDLLVQFGDLMRAKLVPKESVRHRFISFRNDRRNSRVTTGANCLSYTSVEPSEREAKDEGTV
jgi:hypothetical protein